MWTKTHTEGKPYEDREKTSMYKTRKEVSEDTNHANVLFLDFQPPGL